MSSIQNILNRSKDIRSLCSRFTSLSFTAKPQAHHKILWYAAAYFLLGYVKLFHQY